MWIRFHRVPRSTWFAPSEQLQGGPLLSDLRSGSRATITLGHYDGVAIQEDVWTGDGDISLSCDMIRGAQPDVLKDFQLQENLLSRSAGNTSLRTCPFGPGALLVSVPRVSKIIAKL